jgi:hypothetical protein
MKEKIYEIASLGDVPEILVDRLKYHVLKDRAISSVQHEQLFIKEVVQYFMEQSKVVHSIQWHHCNDYNDNFSYFDFEDFTINDYVSCGYSFFTNCGWSLNSIAASDKFDWNFELDNHTEEEKLNMADADYGEKADAIRNSLKIYRPQTTAFFIFFKALFDHYGYFYYIYVFGRRATILINNDEMQIAIEEPNTMTLQELMQEDYNTPYKK